MYVFSKDEKSHKKHEVKQQEWVNSVRHIGTTITDAPIFLKLQKTLKDIEHISKVNAFVTMRNMKV